ncbi:Protein FAM117A, partial [Dryobates pubescens]
AAALEKASCPWQPRVRRTSSLDTVLGSYLLGQWPKDAEGAATSCMNDKATQVQTPPGCPGGLWARRGMQSWPQGTGHRTPAFLCQVAKLRQQLQRTKLSGRSSKAQKGSRLQGDHTVLPPLRDCPSGFLSPSPMWRLSPCLHRSLEGLNQELEEAFVKGQGEEELLRILDVPDGHRAPAPAQRGSADVSLSLEPSKPCCGSLSGPSQALFASPAEGGSPSPVLAFAASPRPNHSYVFKREPPEGCERVRAFEEACSPSPEQPFQPSCPDKNKVHFNPTGSAFCPVSLVKPLFPNVGFLFRGFPASASPGMGTFPSCQPPA